MEHTLPACTALCVLRRIAAPPSPGCCKDGGKEEEGERDKLQECRSGDSRGGRGVGKRGSRGSVDKEKYGVEKRGGADYVRRTVKDMIMRSSFVVWFCPDVFDRISLSCL